MRGSDDRMKALPPLLVRALAALVLVLALGLAAAPAAWADEDPNAVGKAIIVGDPLSGGLEFTITAVASGQTAGTVTLTNGKTYQGDLALYQVENAGLTYAVTAVGASAFKNNSALTGIEFQSDLTGAFAAIGANAFEGCGQLTTVVFPQKVAGIGGSAFLNCISLSSVTFAAGAKLYVPAEAPGAQWLPAIGIRAFECCTALEEITIPAITSTQRSPDYYGWYGGPNTGTGGTNPIALSSYFNFFGPGNTMPAHSYAVGQSAFLNCSSLQSVVFEPSGADWGLFAYFIANQANPLFKGCSNLKSVVFKDGQPYYADPDRALAPGYSPPSYRNVFQDSDVTPSFYYAVDYYATDVESLVSGDDNYASGRYARVEYLRGTPTDAIATSDGGVLASCVYVDASAYAEAGYADGAVPDPQARAEAAGLDASTQWVWKLGATQSRRYGLTDSCYAYLAPATDLSAGRIGAAQITTMYKLCGQNLSQGQAPTQDSPFDVARYYVNEANSNAAGYVFDGKWGYSLVLDAGETAWFTLDSTVEEGFFGQIGVYAADGSLLDADDYSVTFERYDAATGTLIAVELGAQADGPLLMTVKPGEESGYSGALQEWVLVKGQAGSVKESYTASPAATLYAAVQDSLATRHNTSSFVGPYAVAIGSADTPSALIAAAYAGLVLAPINVRDTVDGAYGFALSTHFLPGSGVINGALTTFPATGRTPAEFAVAAYNAFEERQRGLLGAPAELYPWGDTALLVSPGSLGDVAAAAAAYAYAKAAPVFYTEDDGTVSSATLACLAGFDKVAVMGDEALFTVAAFDALEAALGGEVGLVRVSGDAGSAFSLSMAVASLLMDEGLARSSVVTVTDAGCTADAIVALSLAGHEGGLALVSACTADSKLISAFLHGQRDTVRVVRLFGRGASHMSAASFSLYDSLCDLWKDSAATPAVGEGDTLVLYGCQLEIESGDALAFDGVRLWGASGLAAGSYAYGGRAYLLAQDIEAVADPPDDGLEDEGPKDEDPADDPKDDDQADDPKDEDPTDEDPVDDDPTDDPADEDPKDTVPDAPKATGSLTVVPASASAAPKATGSLTVAPFTVEGGQDTDASDDDDGDEDERTVALVSADTPLDWHLGAAQDSATAGAGQQAGPGPQGAAIVGSAVSALGAALWFALRRRRNPVAALAGA